MKIFIFFSVLKTKACIPDYMKNGIIINHFIKTKLGPTPWYCYVQDITRLQTDKFHTQQCKSIEMSLLARAGVHVSSNAVDSRQGPCLSLPDRFCFLLVTCNTPPASSSYLNQVTWGHMDARGWPNSPRLFPNCPLRHIEQNETLERSDT